MLSASRKYILDRRAGGVADLSNATLEDGELNLDQAEQVGVYKVNCSHQIGIATSIEVGLSPDRYPIRVILSEDAGYVPAATAEAVCSYWRLINAAGESIPFTRKPIRSDLALKNLYKYVKDVDANLWTAYAQFNGGVVRSGYDLGRDCEELYNILNVLNPTGEQQVAINDLFVKILSNSTLSRQFAAIKVYDGVYLTGEPHGMGFKDVGTLNSSKAALMETVLCAHVNKTQLKARYAEVSDGVITLASYSIANMFRYGLFESYEHREFYTLVVIPNDRGNNSFRVSGTFSPQGVGPLAAYPVGTVIDVNSVKLKKTFVELGSSMVMASGLMHYLFNHTTGGQVVTGTLLTTMAMYQFIGGTMTHDTQVEITSVMYEALHPTNKRGIANLFFPTSGVTTHGRCTTARRYEKFELDAFLALRCTPHPAGSHKAFICLQALKRVLQAGLGPFLPWAEQLNDCVQTCIEVLKGGARAHIGSSYYTGEPTKAQPSSLDQYLPELAQYVRVFNRGDTLSMSPHLSEEVAKRASFNWQGLMRDLKANDVSATPAEKVREFLATSGAVHFTFDPEDEGTWAGAANDAKIVLSVIDNAFN